MQKAQASSGLMDEPMVCFPDSEHVGPDLTERH